MTTATRLPRGRHRLTPDQVVASQRHRMFRAMAEAMTEKGYAATSVAEVLKRAGVSRETFYQQFGSKQQCFEAAYDAAVAELLGGLAAAAAGPGAPADRFDRMIAAYLAAVVRHPDTARLFLIEVHAAGPGVQQRRVTSQARVVDLAVSILGASGRRGRFACEALVAAIVAMVTNRLAGGDLRGIQALRRPLAELVEAAQHLL